MKQVLFVILLLSASLNLTAQCYMDRHNTTWYDGWLSCEQAPSPNPERGMSHWILYNFGQVYTLEESHVWNVNDPARLNWGMNEVVIDYSVDGENWQELGTFLFDIGTGKSIYEGFSGPDLQGIDAQYLLITGLSNYGGDCYGLSEVRFVASDISTSIKEIEDDNWCLNASVYPNPARHTATLEVQSNCEGTLLYNVTDALGKKVITTRSMNTPASVSTIQLMTSDLSPGVYFINLHQDRVHRQLKLIKIGE